MSPAEGSISNMKDVHRLFLQRFMANRVMSDEDAKRLYVEVNNVINDTDNDDDSSIDERQFHKFLGIIGSALRDAFDFDLRTIIIPSNSIGDTSGGTTRYHAFVNRLADTPAKLYGSSNKNPHEISFFRLILEHIIDDGNSKSEDGEGGRNNNNNSGGSSGCQGSLTDIEIIHLRNELKGPHTNKMNSHDVENALLKFVNEQWLLQVTVNDDDDDNDDDSDDDDDDNNNDDDGSNGEDEEEEEEQQKQKKKKRSSTKKRKRRGRTKRNSSQVRYFIGPRTYMELESVLKDLGLSDMPQSILYSSGGGSGGRH